MDKATSLHDAAFHAADLTRWASEAYAMEQVSKADDWRIDMVVVCLSKAAKALGYDIVRRNAEAA